MRFLPKIAFFICPIQKKKVSLQRNSEIAISEIAISKTNKVYYERFFW